ncbi:MAG TPA: class I SAM-dependent methyltransferase [Gemmataceae bacterium]|jgi:ubiquinone/menaquinone biosynthesis C-methylase UbiE
MAFYRRVIFPRLCDLTLGQRFVAEYRKPLLAQARSDILEIGFGTGLNLPHYPEHVRRITAIEPNTGMSRRARQRIEQSRIEVEQRQLGGERLPFSDDCFDCVVSTFTLCSIDEVSRALGEVYRVLRPGGRFLFLEHGLSPDLGVRKWQRRLNRLQMWLADGCRLDRDMRALVAAQPFQSMECEEFDMARSPRTHGHLYRGFAVK